MPEIYSSDELTSLIQNGQTSGTYRYISYAMQNDFTKTKTFNGVSYLNYLESLGWKTYFQSNAFYAYKEITNVGTQTVTITPFERMSGNYLVVAGGGGGGGNHGGGGGAGGYIFATESFTKSQISVTVGAGGVGAPGNQDSITGRSGGNSQVEHIVAVGGGGGGNYSTNPSGRPGGSGGGGSIGQSSANGNVYSYNSGSQRGTPGYAVTGQGNHGGGGWHASPGYPGGGGGGFGSTGVEKTGSTSGGDGGTGTSNNILGYTRWFAGGGGGWCHSFYSGSGGMGGGGMGNQGNSYSRTNSEGVSHSGGGGGGGGHSTPGGSNGGSGIVVIRYQIIYPAGGIA